ncbi:hypothetical protein E2C01_049228 [Portunus trituberculatus]|uniref:Uncharacterized protein n=1 Tax=Portunus trituberculatus TaxID=210409 RepID=A0A5B7GCK4_PORTR|nr:hypothetical protein [Portunus trituberculatus]
MRFALVLLATSVRKKKKKVEEKELTLLSSPARQRDKKATSVGGTSNTCGQGFKDDNRAFQRKGARRGATNKVFHEPETSCGEGGEAHGAPCRDLRNR